VFHPTKENMCHSLQLSPLPISYRHRGNNPKRSLARRPMTPSRRKLPFKNTELCAFRPVAPTATGFADTYQGHGDDRTSGTGRSGRSDHLEIASKISALGASPPRMLIRRSRSTT
jgi:hypothetical protein